MSNGMITSCYGSTQEAAGQAAFVLLVTAMPLGFMTWIMYAYVSFAWGVVFSAFVVLVMLFICCVTTRRGGARVGPPARRGAATLETAPREPALAPGLHPMAIAAIPTLVAGKLGGGRDGADCAICLGVVQGGDTVKQLPACGHLFHEECVGMWLRGHRTCPLCRTKVDGHGPREVMVAIE